MKIDRAIEILDPRTFPDVSGDEAAEACRMGMEALKRQRCIPVAERPPKENAPVLFWASRFGRWATGYFDRLTSDNAAWFDSDDGSAILSGTHWMHLPAPPERGGIIMPRLIDADELKMRILAFCTAGRTTFLSVEGIVAAINNSDTVDAVPVVRCIECKFYKPDEYECGCDCPAGLPYVKSDDFCSYGERREPNEEK